MSNLNIRLLKQVQAMILKYPENFDMGFFANGVLVADKDIAPHCSTSACIAGWAVALDCGALNGYRVSSHRIADKARELLGLSAGQEYTLFYSQNWDSPFRDLHNEAALKGDDKAYARIAASYIDYYIQKHGGDAA